MFQREKTNKFSLNDNDEELTHYGQSLSQIEKFEEPVVSDEEDDEDTNKGRISGKLTHYGQSLSQIEKFEGPAVSDDEDEEEEPNGMGVL